MEVTTARIHAPNQNTGLIGTRDNSGEESWQVRSYTQDSLDNLQKNMIVIIPGLSCSCASLCFSLVKEETSLFKEDP